MGAAVVVAGLGVGAGVLVAGGDDGPAGGSPSAAPGDGRTSVVGAVGEVGGWDGKAWVGVGEGWEPTPAGRRYQVVGLAGPVTGAESTIGQGSCLLVDEMYLRVDVGSGIAVAGVADPRPRPVALVAPTGTHRGMVRDALPRLGGDDPAPDVGQVVRADLDGDGDDEVLVSGRRSAGDDAVLLVGDGTTTTIVDSQVFTFGAEPTVGAVADLNGDGRMEVVAHRGPARVTVHELADDGSLTPVLAGGCGG